MRMIRNLAFVGFVLLFASAYSNNVATQPIRTCTASAFIGCTSDPDCSGPLDATALVNLCQANCCSDVDYGTMTLLCRQGAGGCGDDFGMDLSTNCAGNNCGDPGGGGGPTCGAYGDPCWWHADCCQGYVCDGNSRCGEDWWEDGWE